jgi:hypothetical protein
MCLYRLLIDLCHVDFDDVSPLHVQLKHFMNVKSIALVIFVKSYNFPLHFVR